MNGTLAGPKWPAHLVLAESDTSSLCVRFKTISKRVCDNIVKCGRDTTFGWPERLCIAAPS